jgi:hypothetical protein
VIPTTTSALVILVAAVLPGSMYTWAYERQAGDFGVALADRVLRFVAVSLAFDAVLAWPAYAIARTWFVGRGVHAGQFALLWTCVVCALALATGAGAVVGGLYATRTTRAGWYRVRRWLTVERETRLLNLAVGRNAAPRAWDVVFSARSPVFLRVRTVAGTWLGGRFGYASYAGGFPNETDLLLEDAWPVDANGTFGPAPLGYAVYVPAATIAYVEIVPREADEEVSHHG